jgi:ribose transport system substrate-binding protein
MAISANGGKVMLFVGRLEQLNAQQRRQGIIDELLEKPEQSLTKIVYDLPGKILAGAKYDRGYAHRQL